MAVQFEAGGKTVTVGGMSKGSGMIHPNMCTMLGFVTTDIAISKAVSYTHLDVYKRQEIVPLGIEVGDWHIQDDAGFNQARCV